MLIFLITILGFVPFAFDSGGPQFRCQVTGLLLLTSVNFRWLVTQRLPSVAYLTSLDKYAIGSLLYLVLFCVWHSIIGSNIITREEQLRKKIDYCVLFGSTGSFIIFNLFYIIWFVKMFKSIRKFQNDGLKDAADQAALRDLLSKKSSDVKSEKNLSLNEIEIETSGNFERGSDLQKSFRSNRSSGRRSAQPGSNQGSLKQNRGQSQPTIDPTHLLASA